MHSNTLTREDLVSLLKWTGSCFVWLKNHGNKVKEGAKAGSLNAEGYCVIKIKGRYYKAHRLVYLYQNGEFPALEIDHINGVKDDNRIDNLRLATKSENRRNRKRPVTNTSGFKGVTWDKKRCRWVAYITHEGRKKQLGRFHSAEDAHKAYCSASTKLHGEFANFGE